MSSIPIPKQKQAVSPPSRPNSWISSSSMSSPGTPKGKQRATAISLSAYSQREVIVVPIRSSLATASPTAGASPNRAEREEGVLSMRRPSMLGSSVSKSEFTVVNLAHSDEPPRLVTCVKSSQGFDWNQRLFLPYHASYDSRDLKHRPDPIEEIVLTDDEAAAIMPQ